MVGFTLFCILGCVGLCLAGVLFVVGLNRLAYMTSKDDTIPVIYFVASLIFFGLTVTCFCHAISRADAIDKYTHTDTKKVG